MRAAVVTNHKDSSARTRDVEYPGTAGVGLHAKIGDGFTPLSADTGARNETATGEVSFSRDRDSRPAARSANYTTINGGGGTKSDVIQRTDEGYSRDATRTLPGGASHTGNVDFSSDGEVKCVRQGQVDQP